MRSLFSPYFPFEEKDAQPLHAAGTPQRVCFARVPGGKDRHLRQPHLRLDGGVLPMKTMWAAIKGNGKPYKELVKIAHPPIIRRNCCGNCPEAAPWLILHEGRRSDL